MKQEGLKIRAHHGMCLHFFEGKGYSNEFMMATCRKFMKKCRKIQRSRWLPVGMKSVKNVRI